VRADNDDDESTRDIDREYTQVAVVPGQQGSHGPVAAGDTLLTA
jgi:hypothetical protein